MSRPDTFDVAVIGGGPAGAVTALLLARAGRRVLVLERSPSFSDQEHGFRGGDSLPPQANPLLRRLGLEGLVRRGPHLPCHGNRSAWGGRELVDTDFLYSPHGHGWHLDRGAFDGDLLAAAEEAGAEVCRPAALGRLERLQGLGRSPGRPSGQNREPGTSSSADPQRETWHLAWRLPGGGHGSAKARFLVDASGQSRVLPRRLGIPVQRFDHLVAAVATFGAAEASETQDARSIVEAAEDGWWYRGLLPGGKIAVMAFADAGSEQLRRLRPAPEFLRALGATRFVGAFDASRMVGSPIVRSAASARPSKAVGEGWLAVGDAAGSFDPLSSQGMMSALAGAEQAARAMLAAGTGALSRYQRYLDGAYADYLEHRRRFYALEQRWPGEAFWARRQGLPKLAA